MLARAGSSLGTAAFRAAAAARPASSLAGAGAVGRRPLVADGRQGPEELREELARFTSEHVRGVEVLAVGPKGVLAALQAAAELEREGSAPAFTLAAAKTEEVKELVRRKGVHVSCLHNYFLTLPPASAWTSRPSDGPGVEAGEVTRLMVGDKTQVQPLAKAVSARVGVLPAAQRLQLETSLGSGKENRRWRVAKLVQAVSRAHGWQVEPKRSELPTRPFYCAASIVSAPEAAKADAQGEKRPAAAESGAEAGGGREGEEPTGLFFRLEILPQGPPREVVPKP
mmetsp:Transcript_112022/g.327600  ORF Transcript_112022/g.327600 Transcript_112022/m.327600 type:complete len:283 (-) Transcript_112022:62-910(-)